MMSPPLIVYQVYHPIIFTITIIIIFYHHHDHHFHQHLQLAPLVAFYRLARAYEISPSLPPCAAHTDCHCAAPAYFMSQPWDYIAKLVCIGDSGTGKSSVCSFKTEFIALFDLLSCALSSSFPRLRLWSPPFHVDY